MVDRGMDDDKRGRTDLVKEPAHLLGSGNRVVRHALEF